MSPLAVFFVLLLAGGGGIVAFFLLRLQARYRDLGQAHESLQQVKAETEKRLESANNANQRFQTLINIEAEQHKIRSAMEAERRQIRGDIERLQQQRVQTERETHEQKQKSHGEISTLALQIDGLRKEFALLEEAADLRSFGFYKPQFNFTTSTEFASQIERVRAEQKRMLQDKTAAVGHSEWQVNGSAVEGRKQINQTLRLLLRAFNGECDAAIARVRYNNVVVMETRIKKAWEAINGLAAVQRCDISPLYRDLKLKELHLTHEYQEKVQEEKEEQRRIREQMREEEVAKREIEKAREDAEREERRYQDALTKARVEVQTAVGAAQARLQYKIEELQRLLEEARTNKERAIARAQMTRSGHVYVISNVGSFGENVFKIGMTRRLDPMDRVRELGDASVPFLFDVHAILFSEDAPALENALHKAFHNRRVNAINERKEFFRVSIDDIATVVRKSHGSIEITKLAEAEEYRKTIVFRNQNGAQPATAYKPVVEKYDLGLSHGTTGKAMSAGIPAVQNTNITGTTGKVVFKRCPKCQREASLQTLQCMDCGHVYSTRFDADGNPIREGAKTI